MEGLAGLVTFTLRVYDVMEGMSQLVGRALRPRAEAPVEPQTQPQEEPPEEPPAPDPYIVLGLRPDAPDEVVEAAYRAIARKLHPDVNGTAAAAELMSYLNAAYSTIKEERKQCEKKR